MSEIATQLSTSVVLPNGRAFSASSLPEKYREWLSDTVASYTAGELERYLSPDSYEALYAWARAIPGFNEDNAYHWLNLATVAAAWEKRGVPRDILDELKINPRKCHELFFKH